MVACDCNPSLREMEIGEFLPPLYLLTRSSGTWLGHWGTHVRKDQSSFCRNHSVPKRRHSYHKPSLKPLYLSDLRAHAHPVHWHLLWDPYQMGIKGSSLFIQGLTVSKNDVLNAPLFFIETQCQLFWKAMQNRLTWCLLFHVYIGINNIMYISCLTKELCW